MSAPKKLQVFTRLPPKDVDAEAVKPPHVGEHELEPSAEWMALVTRSSQYTETGNIVYAIEAFIIAHKLGLYPPAWVVEILAERFKAWHERNGHEPMDKIMGLHSKGSGRRDPAMQAVLQRELEERLAIDCARLFALGITVDAAADAVAARLKNEDWNKSGWKLRELGGDRVKKLYQALGDDMKAWIAESVRAWPDAERADWLRLFPVLIISRGAKKRVTKKGFSRSR